MELVPHKPDHGWIEVITGSMFSGKSEELIRRLDALPVDTHDGEVIQDDVYAVGKEHGFELLRDWFKALHEVLYELNHRPTWVRIPLRAILGMQP